MNKAVSPMSIILKRIDIQLGLVPSTNSCVGGFSSDSLTCGEEEVGGEGDDEWSDRSKWPTTFHQSHLLSLSSMKSG